MLRRRQKRHGNTIDLEDVKARRKERAVLAAEEDDVDEALENLVFGGEGCFVKELERVVDKKQAFQRQEEESKHGVNSSLVDHQQRPAWVDDDDEEESVDISAEGRLKKLRQSEEETVISGKAFSHRLRNQFQKIYGDASWASLDRKNEKGDKEEDEDGILLRTGNYLSDKSGTLPKGILDVTRVKDVNCSKPSNATIQSLEFHPSAKVVLTAGMNKTLDLFQIDGHNNSKLQSVFLKKFPIRTAHFSADGEQVIMASTRPFFYVYDMIKGQVTRIPGIRGRTERSFDKFFVSPDGQHLVFIGNNGYIILLSNKTKQWIANLKMNGPIRAVAFSADGSRMFTAGGDGEVYVWDMNTRSCVHKFRDDGCIMATSLAASRDGQYLACGSDSGVVNVYDDQCLHQTQPKPLKSIMNLTTSANKVLFNSASEMLAISSRAHKDALKLVHLPSLTVFSNWPTSRTPLRYVHSLDFSPNSGYLAMGNDRGIALLYRLNQYSES